MKKERLQILLLVGVLGLSMMLAHTLIALEKDEAVTIVLQGKTIQLYSPFEIVSAMMYKDGGTIAIVIEDGMGSSLPFCLDGRIKRPSKIRHVYCGATHPSDAKAKQVPIGSAAEKAILKILQSAEISEPTPYIREDLVEIFIEELENR
jgi:hypothetical protein